MPQPVGIIDWARLGTLTFEVPDRDAFPCLGLAYDAATAGGDAPATLNAANEVAVAAFLGGRLSWRGIADVVGEVLGEHRAGERVHHRGRCRIRWPGAPPRRRGRGPEDRSVKSPTPEELAESDIATLHAPETGGRQAAVTALLLLAGIVVLAFVRPRLAGTIGVLAAIIAMIMLHELGHFVMAKRAGMKVTEFFLGFGPRLWSIRRGETEYGVKAIPAGGYVRIIGMSNVEEVDPADEERTYRAKPYRHRLGVAVAGSTMHFLIATLLLLTVYAAVGIPSARPIIEQIVPDSPAQHSDFRVGDRIVAVNGMAVKTWEDIPTYVQAHGESQLVFTVIHKGTNERADVSPQAPGPRRSTGSRSPGSGSGPSSTSRPSRSRRRSRRPSPGCPASCGRR